MHEQTADRPERCQQPNDQRAVEILLEQRLSMRQKHIAQCFGQDVPRLTTDELGLALGHVCEAE